MNDLLMLAAISLAVILGMFMFLAILRLFTISNTLNLIHNELMLYRQERQNGNARKP
jgi:hypothetical protein